MALKNPKQLSKEKSSMRKKTGFVLVTLSFISFFGIIFVLTHNYSFSLPRIEKSNKTKMIENYVRWDSSMNLKQSYNACGSYTAMAFVFVMNNKKLDPKMIEDNIEEKAEGYSVKPWGLNRYLNRQGFKTYIYWFGLRPDKFKIKWIKQKIDLGVPVILMVGSNNRLHYITILGYTKASFFIYDSSLSLDKNSFYIGNNTLSYTRILDWWKNAKRNLFPINIAITM